MTVEREIEKFSSTTTEAAAMTTTTTTSRTMAKLSLFDKLQEFGIIICDEGKSIEVSFDLFKATST